jgi:hypothetical protein
MKIVVVGPPSSGKSTILGAGFTATRHSPRYLVLKARLIDRFRLRSLARPGAAPTSSRREYTLYFLRKHPTSEQVKIVDHPGRAARTGDRAARRLLVRDLDEANAVIFAVNAGYDELINDPDFTWWTIFLRASVARRSAPPALLFVRTSRDGRTVSMPVLDSLDTVMVPAGMTAGLVTVSREQAGLPLLWAMANGAGNSLHISPAAKKALGAFLTVGRMEIKPLPTAVRPPIVIRRRRKGALDMMPNVIPRITVTMLGVPGSGKTTYMLAMIGTLYQGISGYGLSIGGDRDDAYDKMTVLMEEWSALRERGALPPPTDNNPRTYPLIFGHGMTPLLGIDWIDYRGGVLAGSRTESDVADMVGRVAASDCIYLVLDAQFLTDGVTGRNRLSIERDTRVEKLSAIARQAAYWRLDQHRSATSMVILITKSDLLRNSDVPPQELADRLVEDVRQLLPVAFDKGVISMIAPVTVGRFRSPAQQTVQPDLVAPRGLHRPLIFSILAHRWQQADEYQQKIDHDRAELDQILRDRGNQRGRWNPIPGMRLDWQARKRNQEISEHAAMKDWYEDWARELVDELSSLLIFRDGERV